MLRIAVLALGLALSWMLAAPAHSAIITYQLSGSVTSPATTYAPTVQTGDAVDITLVVNDATTDGNTLNSNVGGYANGIVSLDLTAGSWSIFAIPQLPGDLTVRNNLGNPVRDSVDTFNRMAGAPLAGATPFTLSLTFVDPSATAVSGDSFPNLTVFNGGNLSGEVRLLLNGVGTERVVFSLDSITIVPEPSTALLLGLGLAALGRAGRERSAR